jgi:GAF domain-containing protein
MPDTLDLAAAITQAARTINQPKSLEETLSAIAAAAKQSIPGFDHVGISTIDRAKRVETKAVTDDLVWELDALQYGLGEGPCVDTLHGVDVVVAPRIRHDQRWPEWVAQAVPRGLRSQLAVRLYVDGEGTVGGLNLYSTSSDEVDAEAESIADLFATHASIALGHARQRDSLNEALQTRKIIGQAIGMLMERYKLDEDRAFAFLTRMSSHQNVKLRDIAQAMVTQANNELK